MTCRVCNLSPTSALIPRKRLRCVARMGPLPALTRISLLFRGAEGRQGLLRELVRALAAGGIVPRRFGGGAKSGGCLCIVAKLLLDVSREQQENAISRMPRDERGGGLFRACVVVVVVAQALGHVEARLHRRELPLGRGGLQLLQPHFLVSAGDAHEE